MCVCGCPCLPQSLNLSLSLSSSPFLTLPSSSRVHLWLHLHFSIFTSRVSTSLRFNWSSAFNPSHFLHLPLPLVLSFSLPPSLSAVLAGKTAALHQWRAASRPGCRLSSPGIGRDRARHPTIDRCGRAPIPTQSNSLP